MMRNVLFLILLTLLCGCAAKTEAPPETLVHRTLLVLPVMNQAEFRGEGATYRCGICGGIYTTGKVEEGGDDFLSHELSKIISGRKTISLIPDARIDVGKLDRIADAESTPNYKAMLADLGKSLGAQLVLVPSVFRYTQRVGSDFAADKPASIAMELDVLDTATGQLVWHTKIDATQSALSENLFNLGKFIKQGGKWLSVEALASQELDTVIERSPLP